MKALLVAIALAVGASGAVAGYEPQSVERLSSAAETTPAYARLVLRKATVESELADLSARVTNEHPSLESKRFELRAIDRELNMMRAFEASRVSKLSSAVGDLILSKVALQVELHRLKARVTPQHPLVAQKSDELAALEREIENVLQ
jgi:uncharacterized protein involved in exopolysaccharide biosynthesis